MVFDKMLNALSSGGQGGTAFEMIAVIILTVLIAYIVGLMISHIVDRKLGDIEIQMPKINVSAPQTQHMQQPPPQIVFRISEDAEGKINLQPLQSNAEHFNPNLSQKSKRKRKKYTNVSTQNSLNTLIKNHPNKIQKAEPFLSVSFEDTHQDSISTQPKINSRTQSDDVPYKDYTRSFVVDTLDYPIAIETTPPPTEVRSKIGCTTDADCNNVYGDGKNVCKSNGTCHCVSGSGVFCNLGPTVYKDPKDMIPEERERFKLKFRSNMTLQDYKNWLMLYKDEIENLRQRHRRNLLKLMRGGQLNLKDIPSIRLKPPTEASDYFQKLYKGSKISVHFPDNGSPLVGSNYNDYNDFVPPENTASSWITGTVDLFKEAGKDDAKALDYHIRPDTRTGADEESVGDIYQKYLKQHHAYADLRKIAKVIDESERPQIRQRRNKNLLTFDSRDLNVKVE